MGNSYEIGAGARVAQNIIKKHGFDKFMALIDMYKRGVSGTAIAEEFGVTRQRINQWKQRLGTSREIYNISPDVELLIHGTISHITI